MALHGLGWRAGSGDPGVAHGRISDLLEASVALAKTGGPVAEGTTMTMEQAWVDAFEFLDGGLVYE